MEQQFQVMALQLVPSRSAILFITGLEKSPQATLDNRDIVYNFLCVERDIWNSDSTHAGC